MALVICMAGLNTRFHDVGFDIPKYLLPWGEGTIISSILRGLTEDYDFNQIILLANRRDMYFKDRLFESVKGYGVKEGHIYYIGDTSGQGHTALIGAGLAKLPHEPLYIHNGDTIVKGRKFQSIRRSLETNDAFVDVFVANNPAYCYVRSENNIVTDIVEKNPVTPYASSGLYCFKSAELYIDQFQKCSEFNKELYVSDILKNMLTEGKKIAINELDNISETIVLGTPQEYGIELAKQALK